jgi:hypothetical protein
MANSIFKKGDKVSGWTVLEAAKGGYRCRCQCGIEQVVSTGNLRSKRSTQCRNCQYAPSLTAGEEKNGRVIVAYDGHGQYLARCKSCSAEAHLTKSQFENARCRCFMKTRLGQDHPASKLIEYEGKTHNINEWLQIAGISREAYRVRKGNGWSDLDALFTPKGQRPMIKGNPKPKKKKAQSGIDKTE